MIITDSHQHIAISGGQLTYPERRLGRIISAPWVSRAVNNTPVVAETPKSLLNLVEKYAAVTGPTNPLFELIGFGPTQDIGHSYMLAYGNCWSGGEAAVTYENKQYYIRNAFYGAYGSGSWPGEADPEPPRHRRPIVHIYQEACLDDQGNHNIWIKVRERWYLFNEAIAQRFVNQSGNHDLQAWLWFCLLGLICRKEPNDSASFEVSSGSNWWTVASSDRNSYQGFGPIPAQNVKTGNYEWLPFVSD